MNEKWFVIINPVSGGKNGPKRWHKIKPLLDAAGVDHEFEITAYIDHASKLTSEAIQRGIRNIAIIGGDGTANDVINGIFQSGIQTNEITVAMLPAGTGNDWVRTIGRYKSIEEIPTAFKRKETFMHDAGLVRYQKNGMEHSRYFINIAGLGFEGHVAKRISEGSRYLQGTKLQYQLAIIRSLFFYRHCSMKISFNGQSVTRNTLSIACGNCMFNGGGLKQLPMAIYDDGELDLTLIGNMSKFKMAISLPKLKSGSHIKMSEVEIFRSKEFYIESERPVFLDADGEFLGETPVHISVIPKAVRVLKFL